MKIQISERLILDGDGKEQISVSHGKTCVSICSGFESINRGSVHFSAKQLSELIDVLQTFLTERGAV